MTSVRPIDCCDVPLLAISPMSGTEGRELVLLFKALADETRFEIFRLIAAQENPICVCDITDQFEVSQPTISHHLKVLREAGLITVSRRGNWAFYGVDERGLELLSRVISTVTAVRVGASV